MLLPELVRLDSTGTQKTFSDLFTVNIESGLLVLPVFTQPPEKR